MPKRRKNKASRKAKDKLTVDDKKRGNLNKAVSNDIKNNDKTKPKTAVETPVKNVEKSDTGINTTPIRKRRMNHDKKHESMNITNLNILFNSEFIYNAEPGTDSSINKSISPRRRSHSSIPKLRSPIRDQPYRKHQCIQTTEALICQYDEEEQTPKSAKRFNFPEKTFPLLKNQLISNSSPSNKLKDEVNVNPYLKKESRRTEGSYNDISFFSPHLFQKYSSTPIETVKKIGKFAETGFDTPKSNGVVSPRTPFFSNVNLNNTPLEDKVLHKEDSMRSLKMHTLNFSTKKKNLKSPKLGPKSNLRINSQLYYSKYDISRNSSFQVILTNSDVGCCDNLFSRLKKLTQHWTGRIVDVCFQLGLNLKKSLSSVCNSSQRSVADQMPCERCKEYEKNVSKLSLRVTEIENMHKDSISQLNEELSKIREEVRQFVNIRSDIESLKDEMKQFKNIPSSTPIIPPPPPLPSLPPPPPPPPPPQLLFTPIESQKLRISKKKTGNGSEKEIRPVISLDDILKVKLKKASERPYQPTPTSHRSNQPSVSLNMLKQVKLRPASRILETPENDSMDVTLSPNSTLRRLLKSDMSTGTRLKRLRRVGGLSYDSVYRRKFNDRREREFS